MRTRTKQITLFVSVLLAWTGLVAFQIGADFGFVGAGVAGLVFVALLLGFFVSVCAGIVTRRWRSTLESGVALLVALSSLCTADVISEHQRVASIASAQPIIAAAERFRMATGIYPRSFDDLVPAYLSAEPRSKMGFCGTRFMLSSGPDRFHLSFPLPAWMLCSYDSRSKEWEIND